MCSDLSSAVNSFRVIQPVLVIMGMVAEILVTSFCGIRNKLTDFGERKE